jgi:hypothetical protein
MTKPVTIPNTFATATTAIPLSNLDADFSTVATALNDANTYSNYAPDTGSANAYVVTLSGVSTTYSAGLRIQFKAGNANTTASTLNVNGGGAKNITYQDATAIASGTIAANSIVDVMYDGTQFLLMNDPAGATGGDVVGPSSATDNAIVRFDGTTGKLVQNSVVTIADSTGDISGVGQLNATTLDATNIEVTNIKAKDGTAAASISDSTGVISITSNPVLSGGTANGVLYLNGSKVATSGSALVFDGSNLGLGVTPSAWGSGYKAVQLSALSMMSSSVNGNIVSNAYFNGTNWIYTNNAYATNYYSNYANNGSHVWSIAPSGTAGDAITFTQAMSLNASGGLQTLNTIGVGNATPSTSGAGITFPATQSASSNANTLDDYEEGTWTPTLRGASTAGSYTLSINSNGASYTKTGRVVTVNAAFSVSSVGSAGTGYAQITGLPFTNSGQFSGSCYFSTVDLDADCKWCDVEFISDNSQSIVYFNTIRDNATSIDTLISGFGAGSLVRFTLTYFTGT